jgi:hypothetical protein
MELAAEVSAAGCVRLRLLAMGAGHGRCHCSTIHVGLLPISAAAVISGRTGAFHLFPPWSLPCLFGVFARWCRPIEHHQVHGAHQFCLN